MNTMETQLDTKKCVKVYGKRGEQLSPCTKKVAWVLVSRKKAIEIDENSIRIVKDRQDLQLIKKKVIKRDRRICIYCGKYIPKNEIATVDHLNPRHISSEGNCGYDDEENLACSCLECNRHKRNMGFKEYVEYRYIILLAYALFITKKGMMNRG